MFFAAVTTEGVVQGGSRALGPYGSGRQSHAVLEWTEPDIRARIARILDAYVPHGLIEVKSTWVGSGAVRRSALSAGVARTLTYSMELLGTRYLVATSASTAVARWQEVGAEIVDEIPPCPYPDDRYRTYLILWDVERCRSERRSREIEKLLASDGAPGFPCMSSLLPLRSLGRGDLEESDGEM